MPFIEVQNISKSFENSIAIENISFQLIDGELLTLLGPSGSGKTTILKLIAGLIKLDTGMIFFDGNDISKTPTEERNIGFVFQSFALFPHLTVTENIAFGLETRNWSKKAKPQRVKELLELVELTGKGKRYPRELSGGERSRVALARAIAPKPSLLLLDEPLSALDVSLKENLRVAIRKIQQQVKISTIYVTHDQKEAMEISDKIIILNQGAIVESGTPQELYLSPKKAFTAKFLGITNIFIGTIKWVKGVCSLMTVFGELFLSNTDHISRDIVSFAIYPERITVSLSKGQQQNEFSAKIIKSNFGGPFVELTVEVSEVLIDIKIKSSKADYSYPKNKEVFITIPIDSIIILQE